MPKSLFSVLTAAVSLYLVDPAHALNTRTWVSGAGVDQEGCGPIASPCRTLQFAHDQTAPRGEINFKDSAGYGSLAITKPIIIAAEGVLAGVLAANDGDAITVDVGPYDRVSLRNLSINGAGTGARGVVFNSGGSLEVAGCVIQGFTSLASHNDGGSGIVVRPRVGTPSIVVVGTTLSRNSYAGFHYSPQAGSTATPVITLDHITATDNSYGVRFSGGGVPSVPIANIHSSVISQNVEAGIYTEVRNMTLSLDNTTVNSNLNDGIYASGIGMSVTMGRSSISNNRSYGVNLFSGTPKIFSYGDNKFDGNGSGATSGTIGRINLQ